MNRPAKVGTTLLSKNIYFSFLYHTLDIIYTTYIIYVALTDSFNDFVKVCVAWKKPSFCSFILKINVYHE